MKKLDNRFWGVLNNVRGQKDIRDIKELFISLLFLKYANDKFITNSYNIVEVPRGSSWEFLFKHSTRNSDFWQYLNRALLEIEKDNFQLEGTFSVFNLSYRFNSIEDSEFIRNLFLAVSDYDFSEGNYSFSEILDSFLNNYTKFEAKQGADFTTPDSVSDLMINLLAPDKGSVMDSACGTGSFFQKINKNYPEENFSFYGQEYNQVTLAFAKLRLAFNDLSKVQFGKAKSTLTEDQFADVKTDFVIMHPPFNVKNFFDNEIGYDPRFKYGLPPKNSADLAWIQHALFHLNETGKAAILLSNSSLFRGGKEAEIRKNIIEADLVESIITLPSQLLSNTSIPCCIWLLNKDKAVKDQVLFIDGSHLGEMVSKGQRVLNEENIEEIVAKYKKWRNNEYIEPIELVSSTSLKKIRDNDYLLTPSRYLSILKRTGIDLSKATILSDVLSFVQNSELDQEKKYKGINIKDLSSSPDAYFLNVDDLKEEEIKSGYKLLNKEVLLIARIGKELKPTYYKDSLSEFVYSSNRIDTFKVDESKVNIDYLISELNKGYVHFQLDDLREGTSMRFVRRKDFLKIKIFLPSIKEQKSIVEKERELRFQSAAKDLGFEKEIAKLKQAQIKDLGSKKHNIMQHLNNVKASADVLTKMMELNNGVLKSDDIIDPRRGVTVEKRFLRLQESLGKVIYYVDNITNELKYDTAEIIDPIKYIKECKERGLQNDLFVVEIIVEKATFQGQKPLISISKNDFEEIYNNILENAINHGFVDKSKSYIFRISIAYIDGFLEINFVNNGKPFPKGIAEKFDVKGEKAGSTAGTGIGLWKVAEIAKHFNCELEVFDEPKSEFPVGFKLKFNLETL